jgi:GTPase SAR1 family protein
MVGLDNAGKTTILYQYLMNEVVHSSPTIGSNVIKYIRRGERIVYEEFIANPFHSSSETFQFHVCSCHCLTFFQIYVDILSVASYVTEFVYLYTKPFRVS